MTEYQIEIIHKIYFNYLSSEKVENKISFL